MWINISRASAYTATNPSMLTRSLWCGHCLSPDVTGEETEAQKVKSFPTSCTLHVAESRCWPRAHCHQSHLPQEVLALPTYEKSSNSRWEGTRAGLPRAGACPHTSQLINLTGDHLKFPRRTHSQENRPCLKAGTAPRSPEHLTSVHGIPRDTSSAHIPGQRARVGTMPAVHPKLINRLVPTANQVPDHNGLSWPLSWTGQGPPQLLTTHGDRQTDTRENSGPRATESRPVAFEYSVEGGIKWGWGRVRGYLRRRLRLKKEAGAGCLRSEMRPLPSRREAESQMRAVPAGGRRLAP